MKLDDHLDALRGLDDISADASATRLRVRRTLEEGHVGRRHVGLIAALCVLLVASTTWALATGKIPLFVKKPAPVVVTQHVEPAPQKQIVPPAPMPAPPVVEAPVVEAPVVVPPPPAPKKIVAPAPAKPVMSPRYQKAHDLYFHDKDYAAALIAWDDYLAAEPNDRFVTEARYNRALTLVRLDKLADAKAALQPFADGTVLDGYRKDEAAKLIEKIDLRLNGTK
ncbi:MAG: hypothetical protein QM831_27640 [Kofleriaceae bacterium]